jgi:hypothetical protein
MCWFSQSPDFGSSVQVADHPVSGKQVPRDEAEKEKAEAKHGGS